MNIERLKKYLEEDSLFQNLIYFETIDSTQKKAKELAEAGVQNGTVVIANMQTAGVGTDGRTWKTEENSNILITLILYPNCKIEKLNTLTIDIAKCIATVIQNLYQIKLDIKEPNDLMLNGKKMGGILTETKVEKEIVKVLLIGIGLDINQKEFPDELKSIATSLRREFQREFEREKIAAEILKELEKLLA